MQNNSTLSNFKLIRDLMTVRNISKFEEVAVKTEGAWPEQGQI